MGMGFLGALGGAGEGMASVGKSWANDLKQQRIQEASQTFRSEEKAEDRAHQAKMKGEDRAYNEGKTAEDREYRTTEAQKERTFRAGESEKDATRRAERERLAGERETARDKERASLGIGVTSGEGQSKRDRVRLDAYNTYLESDASDKESENYQDFRSWASKEVGLTVDPAGVKAVEKAAKGEGKAAAPAKPAGKEPPPGTKVRGPDGKLMVYRGNGKFEPLEGSF